MDASVLLNSVMSSTSDDTGGTERTGRLEHVSAGARRVEILVGMALARRGEKTGGRGETPAQVPGFEGGEPHETVPGVGSDRAVLDTSQRAAIPGPAPSGQRGGGVTARPVVR